MAGFPDETDADFDATRLLIESLPLTYLHVFTYSARPGTPAASMQHQVPARVARERNRTLRELGEAKKSAFMRSFVGQPLEAITLNEVTPGPDGELTAALTDNFLRLRLEGKHPANHWMQVQVNGVEAGSLIGTAQTR